MSFRCSSNLSVEILSTPAALLFAFTRRYASHTMCLEILNDFVLSNCFSQFPVDSSIKLNNAAPSHLFPLQELLRYYGLLRPCSPLRYSHPRGSAPWISPLASERQVPAVPLKRLNQSHATFMPDTTHPVNRFPMDLSQVNDSPLVLMSSLRFRHVFSGSLSFVFLFRT